jgi:hypothetical protein
MDDEATSRAALPPELFTRVWVVPTDRMARIETAMEFDVLDYVLEARFDDRLGYRTIARMLTEDSGILISGTSIRRWVQHAMLNDFRPGHFWGNHWLPYLVDGYEDWLTEETDD